MESPKEFTTRALRIQSAAIDLSRSISGDNSELNRWTAIAKKRGMKWVEGLSFSIEQMKRRIESVA
jgi:hypothetical protein